LKEPSFGWDRQHPPQIRRQKDRQKREEEIGRFTEEKL